MTNGGLMTRHQKLRALALALAIVAGCLPLAFITTLILAPFWRWLDTDMGVESLGHSGPAQWCYWTGLYSLLFVLAWINASRKKSPSITTR